MREKLVMWLECKYCGRDFQSIKQQKYCEHCLSRISKEPLSKSSSIMRMIRNREFIKNYKTNKKCDLCGYRKHPEILDFHYRDRKDKSQSINMLMKTLKSIKMIKEEIEKCILICPNCHRELHLKEGEWKK